MTATKHNPQIGTVIKSDGTETTVHPRNGRKFELEELQQYVGGYIELAPTSDGRTMYVDEEGKLKGKPFNVIATALYKYGQRDRIVGDALIIGLPRARAGAISSSWLSLSSHLNMDAGFWLRVLQLVDERGIKHDDIDAVRAVVREVEQ